jgi:hypothetical protein
MLSCRTLKGAVSGARRKTRLSLWPFELDTNDGILSPAVSKRGTPPDAGKMARE